MHAAWRALVLSTTLVVVPVLPVLAQGGPPAGGGGQGGQRGGPGQAPRDAREIAPEALIGTWVLNVAKSKYTGGTPPKSQVRNFDFTMDGKILCHYVMVNQEGRSSAGHWIVTLDGEEHPEWLRRSGSWVFALVGIKKNDERTLGITVRRYGKLTQTGEWRLSEDGKTLTQFLKNTEPNAQGVVTEHVAVFEKQP